MLQSSPLSRVSASPDPSPPKQTPFLLKHRTESEPPEQYREARPLPFELQERCRIFFEENLRKLVGECWLRLMILDSQALTLLTSLLIAGNAELETGNVSPAFIPAPQYLALAATMAAHPSMTTRTRRSEKVEASVEALRYLGLVLASVGPCNAQFNLAYAFPAKLRSTRRGGRSRRDSESPEKAPHDSVTLGMAQSGSLWAQAGDFWTVVGWAFNCSVRYPKRWAVWLPLLEHILEVLERDWRARSAGGSTSESLILKYLGESQSRRILRALFADGSKQSLREFIEIWKNETAEKKPKAKGAYEKVTVDFEAEEYGNYFNASDESSTGGTPQPDINTTDQMDDQSDEEENFIDSISNPTIADGTAPLGGTNSVSLRMRLFALLLQVAIEMPKRLIDAEALVGLFNTYVRSYPLSLFTSVVSVANLKYFTHPAAAFMVQSLACTLLEAAAPRASGEDLTQAILEVNYLPWAANSAGASENAKLAACVEVLMRIYDRVVGLKWTTRLDLAAQRGSERREEKIQRDSRKKFDGGNNVHDDQNWLRGCDQRMTLLLKLAYRRTERKTGPNP